MSNLYWFLIAPIFIFSYLLILSICRIFIYKKWIKFILQNLIYDLFLVLLVFLPKTYLENLNIYIFIFLIGFIFLSIQWIKSKTIGINVSIKNTMIEIWVIIVWIIWLCFMFLALFQLKPELVMPYHISWYETNDL